MSQPDLEQLGSKRVVLSARLARAVRRLNSQPTGMRVLSILDELGPATVTQLAQADRCSQPTMTGTVNALVEHGWARRTTHPAGARSSLVELTDEGRGVLAQARQANGSAVADRLRAGGRFVAADVATAVGVLREVLVTTDSPTPPADREKGTW